jgi:hypothetical protein
MRRILEVMMLKPITSNAKKKDNEVSNTKLCRYALKKDPMVGRLGRKR